MSIKISELPSAEAVNNGDYIPIVQDGTTKKATASMLSADIATTINSSSTNNTAAGAKAVYDYAAPKKHDSTAQTYGVGTDEKYGHVMLVDDLNSSSLQAGKALSSHQGYVIKGLLDDKQDIINGYNKIDADYVDDTTSENKFITEEQIQEIEELKAENEALLDQIPTATATGDNINVQDSSNLPIQEFDMLGNATQAETPTPDTPQDIHVVTGDNTLEVLGKNLFNKDTAETKKYIIYATGNTGSSNNWSASGFIMIEPSTTYYLSGVTNSGWNAGHAFYDTNKTFISAIYSTNYSITTPANARYMRISMNTETPDNVQLEKGSTATPYEPYTEATQLISLGNIELAKIGDYTDRIYKDNGKWYVYKAIGKSIYTGADSEGWLLHSSSATRTAFRKIVGAKMAYTNDNLLPNLLSNYFIEKTGNDTWVPGTIACYSGNSGNIFLCLDSAINTIVLFKTWLSTHNTIVYYPLATPTYTEITDTTLIAQLENILQMHTNKNVTNAWIEPTGTNAQGGMVLVYRQDLATLIAG